MSDPAPGYIGPASVQIQVTDLGKTGSGGAGSDDDTLNISTSYGAVKEGDESNNLAGPVVSVAGVVG